MLFTSIPVAGWSSTRSSTQWLGAVGEEARGRKAAPGAWLLRDRAQEEGAGGGGRGSSGQGGRGGAQLGTVQSD